MRLRRIERVHSASLSSALDMLPNCHHDGMGFRAACFQSSDSSEIQIDDDDEARFLCATDHAVMVIIVHIQQVPATTATVATI